MNLSALAVKRPVAIVMMVLIIVLLGTVSLTRLPLDLLPEIEVPVAIVSTSYSGVGPQEMENLITRPLEGSIATVGNIDSISSITSQGNSIVVAMFNFGTDMDYASLEMRERVDMIKGALPDGASDPMVMKIDINAMPIYQLSLTSDGDLAALLTLAEDTLQSRLERIEGVASVDITGGYTHEIEVRVDQAKLEGYGLDMNQLAQLMGASNLNLPGGTVRRGDQELSIRTMGEFGSLEAMGEMPVTLQSGGVIQLSDVAEVNFVNRDISRISRTNGRDSINISLQKQSATNTVQVADRINAEVQRIQADYPEVELTIVMDQSEYIKAAINSVFKSAIFGALLAILILYLFLRNIRTTLIIGTSIPVSIIATFTLLYLNGITLNLMTLGGLALGVGMLVDNAIVVLENIYRFRSEGYSKKDAAVKGASEVAMAVVASTLTTVAVFLPIVFVEGMISTIFTQLALTVALSLGASLLVSLTLIPMLASKILKVENRETDTKKKRKIFTFFYDAFDRVFGKVEGTYKKILSWSLRHRKSTIFLAAIVFIGSMASIIFVGAEFFPATDEGQINVSVSLPPGSQLQEVNHILLQVEEQIAGIEEVQVVAANAGGGQMMGMGGGQGTGQLIISLIPLGERSRATEEVADEMRGLVRDIPGAEITVAAASDMMMGVGGDPISIRVQGDDLGMLEQISNDIKGIVESVEGTREASTSIGERMPEVQVAVDKVRAASYGLTTAQVANAVRGATDGITATRYQSEGNEIDVVIRGTERVKESLTNLEQVNITTPMGGTVPLGQVANVSVERGPVQINRENQVRTVSVSGQITGRDLRSVTDDIGTKLAAYDMPEGYSYEFGGQEQELNDALADLSLALGLAVILIYMILAAQFESLLHPFTIILSVPLAFAGGALGLFVTGRSLSVPAFIGVIILAGIVVNNAIVLVDYINTLRSEGKERADAITIAGPIRLRPILMTVLTTALGLLPLAIGMGEGAEVQAPMATVVIGGLLLSTVLTLVLIPVVYTIVDDFSVWLKRKIKKLDGEPAVD